MRDGVPATKVEVRPTLDPVTRRLAVLAAELALVSAEQRKADLAQRPLEARLALARANGLLHEKTELAKMVRP